MGSPLRTWLVSATAAAGVIGGGIAVAATSGSPASPSPQPTAQPVTDSAATAQTAQLHQRLSRLLAEERQLRHSAEQARRHLQAQLAAHQNAALHQATVPVAPAPAPVVPAPVVNTPAPVPTHTTSGASGAQSGRGGDDGESEGGHDD